MRTGILRFFSLMFFFFFFYSTSSARVWRINNNPGADADFTSLAAAESSSSVVNGDVIYVEPSATIYDFAVGINKVLTIIGPGYFLNENTGLQLSNASAEIADLYIGAPASGSIIMGMKVQRILLNSDVSNVTITRSHITNAIQGNVVVSGTRISNLVINKCYLGIAFRTFPIESLQVTNCIIANIFEIYDLTNALIRNNTFTTSATIANSYISNNIFSGPLALNFSGCTVKNNLSTSNNLPASDDNLNNITTPLFVGTGSTDGRFQLAAGSPAIGAGEMIGVVKPDAGAFGTADPYRLSGIPSIPTIYFLSVPVSVSSSDTNMMIRFSTRSNN